MLDSFTLWPSISIPPSQACMNWLTLVPDLPVTTAGQEAPKKEELTHTKLEKLFLEWNRNKHINIKMSIFPAWEVSQTPLTRNGLTLESLVIFCVKVQSDWARHRVKQGKVSWLHDWKHKYVSPCFSLKWMLEWPQLEATRNLLKQPISFWAWTRKEVETGTQLNTCMYSSLPNVRHENT